MTKILMFLSLVFLFHSAFAAETFENGKISSTIIYSSQSCNKRAHALIDEGNKLVDRIAEAKHAYMDLGTMSRLSFETVITEYYSLRTIIEGDLLTLRYQCKFKRIN